MYKIIASISVILRTFIFRNPFTGVIQLVLADSVWSTSAEALADIFNFTFGGVILLSICYPLVGIVYNRGEAPAIGSILYGLAVLFNSWILSCISTKLPDIKPICIVFILAIAVEVIILLQIRKIKDKILN